MSSPRDSMDVVGELFGSEAHSNAMEAAAEQTLHYNESSSVSNDSGYVTSRGSIPAGESPVKYTPISGRTSRAKKGVPVHPCDICKPVKTFTRAEHLRRHKLSHQKLPYPCMVKDCEKRFQRADVLSCHHMYRHETQGEMPYRSSGTGTKDRSESDSITPTLIVGVGGGANKGFGKSQNSNVGGFRTDAALSGSWNQGEHPILRLEAPRLGQDEATWDQFAENERRIVINTDYRAFLNNSEAANFSSDLPYKGLENRTQLPGQSNYLPVYPGMLKPTQENFSSMNIAPNEFPSDYSIPTQLPLLRLPDVPVLYSSDASPWCSSASDSTFSSISSGSQVSMNNSNGRVSTAKYKKLGLSLVEKAKRPRSMDISNLSKTKLISLDEESNSSSDPSAGFETESSYSEDESHEGDAHNVSFHEHLDIFQIIRDELSSRSQNKAKDIMRPTLTLKKRELVERVMKEFWQIFNQEWVSNVRKCATGGGCSSSTSVSKPDKCSLRQHVSSGCNKRTREDDHDRSEDEEYRRNPKQPGNREALPTDRSSGNKFACPYRKHDPRKYNIRDWRVCALTPLDSVSRVKGHLYRHHRVFQCQRCKETFSNQEDLDGHFVAMISCELRVSEPAEGITSKLEKQLRSRKKISRLETEEERWTRIYEILFPTETVPSPHFEPIEDEPAQSPDSRELAQYEEYSRRELPRFFRQSLEETVNDDLQPIEERLKSQLVDMIRDCQDRVLSTYKSKFATCAAAQHSSSIPPQIASNPNESSMISMKQTILALPPADERQRVEPLKLVTTLYEEPQHQYVPQISFATAEVNEAFISTSQAEWWEATPASDTTGSNSSSAQNASMGYTSNTSSSDTPPSSYDLTSTSELTEPQFKLSDKVTTRSDGVSTAALQMDFSTFFNADELASIFDYNVSQADCSIR